MTVSVGIAFGFEADHSMAILELADRRLYDAKATGRNRLVDRPTSA